MNIETIRRLIREDKMVKFYQSKPWRELRATALKRDHNECQRCKAMGKVVLAQNVHHLKEVKQFPELALELDNLESICINCHNKEHKRLEKYIKRNKFWSEEKW